MKQFESPFNSIDFALAKRVCQWHNSEDVVLYQSIVALSFALSQGHSCLSLADCLERTPYNQFNEFEGVDFPVLEQWLAHLEQFNLSEHDSSPIVLFGGRLYLRRYWQFETELAKDITSRISSKPALEKTQIKLANELLESYFANNDELDWQKVATANALYNNFNIIIGGPGTGKTFTVTRILALLAATAAQPPVIRLAAPTGKAAQRLAESIRHTKQTLNLDMFVGSAIPETAETLHRLLGVIPNSNQFKHNADNLIDADILLIDEISMVDLPLMTRVFRALKADTKILMLGDADQLPSVAAGSVLADIIPGSGSIYSKARAKELGTLGIKIPSKFVSNEPQGAHDYLTTLTVSRRFGGQSGIGRLAEQVIAGEFKESLSTIHNSEDLHWLPADNFKLQLQAWAREHFRDIPKCLTLTSAFNKIAEFRILCAIRETDFGVDAINEFMVSKLNTNRQPFYKGQPIMVTANHYGLSLFNGDIGLVWPDENGQLMVWFELGDEFRPLAPGRLPTFETVYALTIHKTQGSEFENVALVLPSHPLPILTRELLYTGITRAKKTVTCLGEEYVWKQAVKAHVKRWAGLADRLRSDLPTV